MEMNLPNVIRTLNESIYYAANKSVQEWIENVGITFYECHSNGWADVVDFLGEQIWNSEDDQRKYLEEEVDGYEPIEPFLRRKANKILGVLIQIKL